MAFGGFTDLCIQIAPPACWSGIVTPWQSAAIPAPSIYGFSAEAISSLSDAGVSGLSAEQVHPYYICTSFSTAHILTTFKL